MSRLARIARAAALAVVATTVISCDRSITQTEQLPSLVASSLDASAGSWKMIVLSAPNQVAVPAPASITSDAYRLELAAIKSAQRVMTAAQRERIAHWSGGGVLRWDQVLRGLVARYNLPPAPRAGGSYPVPDASNPFADPAFPFANPPYAARAYSFVAVAQYEALKAAWFYKFQYNRPSPARVDADVRALMPVSELPAYPSEDAVMAGASVAMLQALFPAAVEEITRRGADQREAALLSGKASSSDLAAGLALGRAVAAQVLARMSTDGTAAAVGTPMQWAALADSARARGEIPWISLDGPARPPMLPNFGAVLSWAMTSADVVAARPKAPFSTSSAEMQAELAEVRRTVKGLTREQRAIALKWNDGAGTYAPPGHWNDIAAEYIRDAQFSEVRAARAFALLNMAMHDASVGCWEAKFRYFSPRPSQLDPSIRTEIGLPNFPAYPSGHSTFSAAAANVLGYLFPGAAPTFKAMSDQAGMSRMYGGIHFRNDIVEGSAHGDRIAAFTIRFAQGDRAP
ncbi:MAG: phosphatase PAP2 family protein [Gemmatimonadaceae bacterium]|nr:phosphatase PAP2 family protein [Gemmatimonadaceae bacterium]